MIKVENINFTYDKNIKTINNLSFHVPENSIFGFLGANGSGKTTTIRIMLNLCKPSSGKVFFNDKNLTHKTHKLYNDIGALIESPTLYNHLTGLENLQLLAKYYNVDKDSINHVLNLVELFEERNKKVKKYSLGMKQRLGIAQSILHDPKIIILDEPLNGLDPKGINHIRNLLFQLKKEGKTILISSHLLDEIEKTCDNICIIDKGKELFSGKVEELQEKTSKSIAFDIKCNAPKKASEVLAQNMQINAVVNDSQITFNLADENNISSCVKTLVNNNIDLFKVAKKENSLEDLFLKLTRK